ncbi:MAG: menaquinone biosynthesis protein [Planctomycetaceae bacterium]|jgi:chorismate dehydratase|nr:menaquinone biosynthesis protein [Planctomycetaceae bacterium]
MFLKICTVPYYNTLPLTWFLEEYLAQFSLTCDYPSRLGNLLTRGEANIAMTPVVSMAFIKNCVLVSDAVIGCHGGVKSVKLYSKKPLDKIERLALDADSRTSVALAQAILREYYKNDRYKTVSFSKSDSADEISQRADACVMIGDRALTYQPEENVWRFQIDLGELWLEKTGFPFVFAAWITNADRKTVQEWEDQGKITALELARDKGVANLSLIVSNVIQKQKSLLQPPAFPIEPQLLEDYYRRNVVYKMTDAHHEGLRLFFRLGRKHQLFGQVRFQ